MARNASKHAVCGSRLPAPRRRPRYSVSRPGKSRGTTPFRPSRRGRSECLKIGIATAYSSTARRHLHHTLRRNEDGGPHRVAVRGAGGSPARSARWGRGRPRPARRPDQGALCGTTVSLPQISRWICSRPRISPECSARYCAGSDLVDNDRDNGGKTAAVLLSFIATCKRNAVEPFAWFRDVLTQIAMHPIHRIEEFLPHNWKALGAAAQVS